MRLVARAAAAPTSPGSRQPFVLTCLSSPLGSSARLPLLLAGAAVPAGRCRERRACPSRAVQLAPAAAVRSRGRRADLAPGGHRLRRAAAGSGERLFRLQLALGWAGRGWKGEELCVVSVVTPLPLCRALVSSLLSFWFLLSVPCSVCVRAARSRGWGCCCPLLFSW